jgi:hypothetical protein
MIIDEAVQVNIIVIRAGQGYSIAIVVARGIAGNGVIARSVKTKPAISMIGGGIIRQDSLVGRSKIKPEP